VNQVESNFTTWFATLAGWHDGVRIRVRDDVESPLVSIHEGIHEKILSETPDGQVHAAFLAALREGLVKSEDKTAVETTVKGIFEHSQFAQEVFANYLAIKQLPADSENRYLSEPHSDYREYFDVLSEIIDEHIPTSFLQYVVGWALGVVVFSSTLIERVPDLKQGQPLVLSTDEQPSARLKQLIRVLRKHDLAKIRDRIFTVAQEECARRALTPWNFSSEYEWMTRTFVSVNKSTSLPAMIA
jgi:hypothetical protein